MRHHASKPRPFVASTLANIKVVGPDAVEFMSRMYTNPWTKLVQGRCRAKTASSATTASSVGLGRAVDSKNPDFAGMSGLTRPPWTASSSSGF